jgi:hypothetical protein
MSDERDETRPFTPRSDEDDDATRPSDAVDPDATQVGGFPAADDATRVGGVPAADDATRVAEVPAADDATRVGGFLGADDETIADPVRPGPGSTSVMPAANDDWASSRANAAWQGRAEVRAPQPGTYQEQTDDWPAPIAREPRDRWWMPIVVGIIALILLAALAFGIYLIVQNTGNDPAPAPTTPPTVAPTQTTTQPPTTPPSTEPTTTSPSPTPSTTEPTTSEITIPALKGMPLQAAEAALSNVGLHWRVLYREDDALGGTVIDSDPAEGQEVPPDTRVTLVVAGGNTQPTTAASDDGGGGTDED